MSALVSSHAAFDLYRVTPDNKQHTVPAVLDLITKLAIYEKEPDAVEATVDLLEYAILGTGALEGSGAKGGHCEAVVAHVGGPPGVGKAVGLAIFFYTFSTWTGRAGLYLEDLFVDESMRGQGVGKALFQCLGKRAKELDCPRMDWVVLDWNLPAKEVYRRMGASHKKEWEGMRLEGAALDKLAQP